MGWNDKVEVCEAFEGMLDGANDLRNIRTVIADVDVTIVVWIELKLVKDIVPYACG